MMGSSACEQFNDRPIVEQMLDTNVDVMLGGGTNLLPARVAEGGTVKEKAEKNGYTIITKRDELNQLQAGTKTFGVFSRGHLPVEWVGPGGKGADFLKTDGNREVIYPH